jgi:hypothetical protein
MGLFDEDDSSAKGLFDEDTPALTPAKKAEKVSADSYSDRFGGNIAEAMRGSLVGVAARTPSKYYRSRSGDRLKPKATYDREAKEYRDKRIAEIMTYNEIPDWHRHGEWNDLTDLPERVAKLGTSAAGQFIGGLTDPLNLVPMGKGATALKTFLKGASSMAAYGALTEYASQTADIELGARKDYDWEAIAASSAASGVMGGAVNAGTQHGEFLGRGSSKQAAIDSQMEKVKANKDADIKAREAAPEGKYPNLFDEYVVEPSKAEKAAGKSGPIELFDEFKVDAPLDEHQTAFTNALDAEQPLPELILNGDGEGPYHPTQGPEGMEPVARFREEFPSREVNPAKQPKGYPKISKEFRPADKPNDLPTPQDVPPIENGFGPDVTPNLLEDAPFMPGRLAEQANVDEMQGSHQMDLVPFEGVFDPEMMVPPDRADTIDTGTGAPQVDPPLRTALQEALEESGAKYRSGTEVVVPGMDGPQVVQRSSVDPGTGVRTYQFQTLDKQGLPKTLKVPETALRRAGALKQQGGYIDIGEMFKWFETQFKPSAKHMQAFKERVAAAAGEFPTVGHLRSYLENNTVEDLPSPRSGNIRMNNQLALAADKNKIVPFVFNDLAHAARKAERRIQGYDSITKPSIEWAKKNVEQAAKFFREWEHLNAVPSLRRQAQAVEEGGLEALIQHMESVGVDPATTVKMEPFVRVLQNVLDADNLSLQNHGRSLDKSPLYFPLARNGPYHFLIHDDYGQVRSAFGYESLAEAKKALAKAKKVAKDGWTVSEIIRTDPTRHVNSAMTAALLEGNPKWLRDLAANQFMDRAEYRRNFELGRSKTFEINGYLGEVAPTTKADYDRLLRRYLDTFAHRVRESHHLENASKAVELGNALLVDRTIIQDKYPRTFLWLNSELSRHIGMDISAVPNFDKFLQDVFNKGGRMMTHIDSVFGARYKVNPNDNVLSQSAAKAFTRQLSYTASLFRISLVPQVLAGNLVTNALIPVDGMRNAALLGVSPHHALKAMLEEGAYMATLGQHSSFAEARKFMARAKEEGMIDPHGREDFSVVENPVSEGFMSGLDRKIQAPRDWVERATNYNSVLYYYHFVKSAFPELKGKEFDNMVHQLSRSFTGDYSQHANMFLFDKMGTTGHLSSNFAKWKFNRTSRYLHDLETMSRVKELGPTAVMPLAYSLVMGALMAGVQGTVGLVEWEAIRQFGLKTGWWNLKPMSAILSENFPSLKDTWLDRGVTTLMMNSLFEKMGEKSGPDISGSIRESSFLEPPTVSINFAMDVGSALGVAAKSTVSNKKVQEFFNDALPKEGMLRDMWNSAQDTLGKGVGSDDVKAAIKVLPTAVQEAAKAHLNITRPIVRNGKTEYVVPEFQKEQANYIRTPVQQALALLGGLKTTDETLHTEAKGYHRYQDKEKEANLKALNSGVLAAVDEDRGGVTYFTSRDRIRDNVKEIQAKHGSEALERLLETLEKRETEKMRTDYFGLQTLEALNARDETAQRYAIEHIKKALALKGEGLNRRSLKDLSSP